MTTFDEEVAILLKSYGAKNVKKDLTDIQNVMKGVGKQANLLKGNFMNMSTFTSRMKDGISASMTDVKKQMSDMSNVASKNLSKISQGTSFVDPKTQKLIQQEMDNLDKVFKAMDADMIKSQKEFDNMSKSANKNMKKISKSFEKPRQEFAGWALSIMFLGMAMQRVFDQIWKAGTKAFQDVMHSVQGTVTTFDILNGQFDYLKYTVGSALSDALAPMLPTIIDIVERFSQWVNENPKLIGGLVILIGAIGTLMAYFGILKLGFDGIISAIGIFSGTWSTLVATLTGSGGLAGLLGVSSVLVALGIVAAVIAGIIILWETNLGGFREFIGNTFGILKSIFGDIFTFIKNTFKNVMEFIINVFNGDWDKAFANLVQIIGDVVKLIINIWIKLGAVMVNIIIFAVNFIVDFILKTLVGGILSALSSLAKSLGLTGFSNKIANAKQSVSGFADKIDIGYIDLNAASSVASTATGYIDRVVETRVNNITINNPSGDEINSEINRYTNQQAI